MSRELKPAGTCVQLEAAARLDTAGGIQGGAPPLPPRVSPGTAPSPAHCEGQRYKRSRVCRGNGGMLEAFSCNTMLAWNQQVVVSDAMTLSTEASRSPSSVSAAIVRNAYPFNVPGTSVIGLPSIRYMELTIDASCTDPYVALGIVHESTATKLLREGMHLGCYSGPWEGSFEVRPPVRKDACACFCSSSCVALLQQSVCYLSGSSSDTKWQLNTCGAM